MKYNLLFGCFCVYLVSTCLAQMKDDASTEPPTDTEKTSTPGGSTADPTTPASTVAERCASRNNSCEECVGHAECLWCSSKYPHCIPYPTGDIIPGTDTCDLSDARWGVCWVNYEILLICMGTLGGVILITLCCCIYCCCCRTNKAKQRKKYQKEDEKIERERQEREMKHNERKAERKQKYDEIRKKYGLIRDDNPYQRFDDS